MTLVKFKNSNGLGNFPILNRNLEFPTFFADALDRLWSDEDEHLNWIPSANIKERAEDFIIDLALPGMDKKDIHIEMENKLLVIHGERKEESIEENEKITRREFHFGSFKRSFNLPETADSDNITANYQNGVLSLLLPKKAEAKLKAKKQITIE